MSRRKSDFAEADKIKVLLWCNRHCCLCGLDAGPNLVVAHLEASSRLDDAMPLCFTCQEAVDLYHARHPKERQSHVKELKARRDQVYEQQSRPLVPPVQYGLKQRIETGSDPPRWIELPEVGFEIVNLGERYPVRARVVITLVHGAEPPRPDPAGHFDGSSLWNLNPQLVVQRRFAIPASILKRKEDPLRARLDVSLIDIHDREHPLLPVGYIHTLRVDRDWDFEPAIEELVPR